MDNEMTMPLSGSRQGTAMRPDWVMCGAPLLTGGVRLMASKSLSVAQLTVEMDYQDVHWGYETMIPDARVLVQQRISLNVEMRTDDPADPAFILIDAPDYPTALKALFETWSPVPDARTGIGPALREITT